MMPRLAASLCLVLGLTGCFSSQITLDYQPRPGMHLVGKPVATVGRFYDNRGTSPYYVGIIHPSLSSAQETIFLRVPAEEAVRNATLHALEARGMLAPSGAAYYIAGEIEELGCQMYSRPAATARLRIHVLDARNDRILFGRTYTARRQAANWQPGFYDPVPIMREITSRALQDAIDQALDDPALRRCIRSRTSRQAKPDKLPLPGPAATAPYVEAIRQQHLSAIIEAQAGPRGALQADSGLLPPRN